ncbi:hypothetical protein QCA50_019102 [Cerrena zonata]|uniref:BRCT domain-containing protein n=1 Tax=Cerrena zonata TaxID=2478898 RepID=A0AAW0FFA4_9APHY
MKRLTPATMSPEKKALYETLLTSPSQDPDFSKATPRNIWKERKILLDEELGLTESQRRAHEADIEREDGVVVHGEGGIEEADIVVTRYRAGPTYVKAFRLKKMIGSLSWLRYVRLTGKISRPTDQLLHYPIPKRTVEGFSNHSITITNYTGKDREYLKKLIATLGGDFTPSMSGKNTVVIAAYHQGTKTEKAVAWGIPVVNYLWLEDCFINWRNLTTTNEKYTCFPPGVDFGSMLGEKGIGRIGYDAKELDALEKDVGREESVLNGELSPKKTPANKGKGKERETQALARTVSAKEVEEVVFGDADEDVVMNGIGEISVGGALEVELDHMDVDDDDPFVSSKGKGKAKASPPKPTHPIKKHRVEHSPSSDPGIVVPTNAPQTLSIRAKMKMKAQSSSTPAKNNRTDDDEDDIMDVEEGDSSPMQPTPKRGRPRKNPPADGEDVEALAKRRRGRPRKSVSRPRVGDQSEGESPPKRGRGRPRKSESHPRLEEQSNVEEVPKRGRGRPRKSESRPRPAEPSDDEEEQPKKGPGDVEASAKRRRGRPRKSVSRPRVGDQSEGESPPKRGRGRPRKSESHPRLEEQSNVEEVPKRGRGRPRKSEYRPRPAEPSDDEEEQPKKGLGRPKKVPYDGPSPSPRRTRSQSRARAGKGKILPPLGDDEDLDIQVISGPKKTLLKACKGKAIDSDSEDEVVSLKKRGQPSTSGATAKEKRKQVIDDDSEEDAPKPKSKRKEPIPIEIDTEDEDERGRKTIATPGKTPKRRLFVVVSTREQAYSLENLDSPKRSAKANAEFLPGQTKAQTNRASTSKRRHKTPSTSPSPSTRSPSPPPKIHKILKLKAKAKRPQTPSPNPNTGTTHRRRPSGVRFDETPAQRSPSRRSAVTKATKKLREEVMPDMNQFQKQLKRSREESPPPASTSKDKGKKRASMGDRGECEEEENERENKRAKKDGKTVQTGGKLNKKDPSSIVIMTTQVRFTDDVKRSMTRLGVSFTTNPSECTHLVAKNLVRTEKFLCAMTNAPIVVTDKWIEMCASTHQLLIEDDCLLSDPANEKKLGVNLKDALERAEKNKGKLFSGMTFYITSKIPVGTKLLKNVITAGGGKVGTGTPTVRILKANSDRHVISCPDDKAVWRPLAEAGYPVYNQELILTGMLKQEIEWDKAGNKVLAA